MAFGEWRCLRSDHLGCVVCLQSWATPEMAWTRVSGVVARVGFAAGEQNVKAETPQVNVILKAGLSIISFSL